MPYKRSYNGKGARRRPGYRACGKMVISDASKALRLAQNVRRLINVEYKFIDTQNTTTGVSTTPVIVQLSNISQGDSTITRDGSQLKVLSIQWSYFMTMHASARISLFRCMLIKDKQTNQLVYTAADVLSDVIANDMIVSPYNRDNRKRFTILYDKVHMLEDNGRQIAQNGQKFSQEQILRYDGNAGTIADLTQSSYSLLLVSTEPSNTVAFTSFIRLNFVDN